ncbi:MAG: hypothetical protein ACLPVY_11225 [Acidimicrobiia bacterium]
MHPHRLRSDGYGRAPTRQSCCSRSSSRFAAEVACNGASSQGPVSAYLGKLASLLGRQDVADDYLHAALSTATAFGWEYHRATTLIAHTQSRLRRTGALDADALAWLDEADAVCTEHRLRSCAKQIETVRG